MATGHPARTGRWDESTTLAGLIGKKPAKKAPPASDKDKEVQPSDKPNKS